MAKVLVVEDEPALRELYEGILKDAGFTVDTASDGAEGLEKIGEVAPDIMLLDLIMPKVDGFDVLKKIRSNQSFSALKIIVLTNIFADKTELTNSGADLVLIKADYTPDQIIQKVHATLGEKSS